MAKLNESISDDIVKQIIENDVKNLVELAVSFVFENCLTEENLLSYAEEFENGEDVPLKDWVLIEDEGFDGENLDADEEAYVRLVFDAIRGLDEEKIVELAKEYNFDIEKVLGNGEEE